MSDNDDGEIPSDPLRPNTRRDRQLAWLDAAIRAGLADVEAGRVHDADEVFDELEARYEKMVRERGEL